MTQIKGLLIYLVTIMIGWMAFFSANIAYALFTLGNFIKVNQTIIFIVPFTLLTAFGTALWASVRAHEKRKSKIKSVLVLSLAAIIGGWTLLASILYFFEHDLLYTNSPVSQRYYKTIQQQDNIEEIHIKTSDGAVLHGYLINNQGENKSPLAIYFGGRGEEASSIVRFASMIEGQSLAFINYRGCGLSTGRQNEASIFADACVIYDYFASRGDIDKENISLIGHSLGTGVAVHLASQRDAKAIVLSTPYDTYTSGVIGDRIPLIPIGRLLSDKFDSLALGPKVETPALFLLAEDDIVVLRHRSIRLFESWGGEAKKLVIKGTHHTNIIGNEDTWDNINSFLAGIEN